MEDFSSYLSGVEFNLLWNYIIFKLTCAASCDPKPVEFISLYLTLTSICFGIISGDPKPVEDFFFIFGVNLHLLWNYLTLSL